jgi:MFS family permease
MLRSRAIPVSFRFYIGFAVAAILGALVAALGSNDSDAVINRVLGPLTIGWKGAVGDHLAYAVLLGVAVAAGFVGIVLTAFREADASAVAQVVDLEAAPLTRAPLGANYWPIVSVFALAVLLIGLSISSQNLAIAGGIALGAAALMWTMRAWAERATGNEQANVQLYRQLVEPIRLPVLSILLIGILAIGFSRVLLALPNTKSSAAVFGVVALVFLLGAIGVALKPRISRSIIVLLLFGLGLAIVVGGIVGAAMGHREFHKHEIEPAGQEAPAGAGN